MGLVYEPLIGAVVGASDRLSLALVMRLFNLVFKAKFLNKRTQRYRAGHCLS